MHRFALGLTALCSSFRRDETWSNRRVGALSRGASRLFFVRLIVSLQARNMVSRRGGRSAVKRHLARSSGAGRRRREQINGVRPLNPRDETLLLEEAALRGLR